MPRQEHQSNEVVIESVEKRLHKRSASVADLHRLGWAIFGSVDRNYPDYAEGGSVYLPLLSQGKGVLELSHFSRNTIPSTTEVDTVSIFFDGGGKRNQELWQITRHVSPRGRARYAVAWDGGGASLYSIILPGFSIDLVPVTLDSQQRSRMARFLLDTYTNAIQLYPQTVAS